MAVDTFVRNTAERGLEFEIREMDDTTHTAQDAANALGCPVEAIVKSLLFLTDEGPVLVLASGANRVDTALVAGMVGVDVAMADAKNVKRITGYSIGGVPPLGHPHPIRTVMDETLLDLETVWAAAGSAKAVFPVEPALLAELVSASVGRVS